MLQDRYRSLNNLRRTFINILDQKTWQEKKILKKNITVIENRIFDNRTKKPK